MSKKNEIGQEINKHLQSKFMEFQMLEQQIKMAQQQLQKVDSQLMDIQSVIESLTELQESSLGKETLIPVSNGIFIPATISKTDQFVVNVGGGVFVKKSFADTVDVLNEQIKEIANFRIDLVAKVQSLSLTIQSLEQELQALIGQVKN